MMNPPTGRFQALVYKDGCFKGGGAQKAGHKHMNA